MKNRILFTLLLGLLLPVAANSESFEELLRRYIFAALDNNPGLRAQSQVLEAARMQTIEARGNMFPSFDFTSRYSRAGGGRQFVFDLNQYGLPLVIRENFLLEREQETKFSITQPLFTGGSHLFNYRSSRWRLKSSKYRFETASQDLMLSVAEAYINYLSAAELVKAAEARLKRAEETLRVSRLMVESGSAVSADTLRTKAELSTVNSECLSARNKAEISKCELKRVIGDLNCEISIPHQPPEVEYASLSRQEIESAETYAVSHRLEIGEIEAAIKSSRFAQKAVRGVFLPSLLIAADYGWQGEEYDFDSEHDLWMVSGVLRWNLFNGFADRASWNETRLKGRELNYRKEEAISAVRTAVKASALEFNDAIVRWEAAKDNLQAAEENYRIRKTLYETGTGSLLDLLEAEDFLSRTVAAEITGRYIVIISDYKFRRAKGENLQTTFN